MNDLNQTKKEFIWDNIIGLYETDEEFRNIMDNLSVKRGYWSNSDMSDHLCDKLEGMADQMLRECNNNKLNNFEDVKDAAYIIIDDGYQIELENQM